MSIVANRPKRKSVQLARHLDETPSHRSSSVDHSFSLAVDGRTSERRASCYATTLAADGRGHISRILRYRNAGLLGATCAASTSPVVLRYSRNPPHRRGMTQPTRADSPIKARGVFSFFSRYQHDESRSDPYLILTFVPLAYLPDSLGGGCATRTLRLARAFARILSQMPCNEREHLEHLHLAAKPRAGQNAARDRNLTRMMISGRSFALS